MSDGGSRARASCAGLRALVTAGASRIDRDRTEVFASAGAEVNIPDAGEPAIDARFRKFLGLPAPPRRIFIKRTRPAPRATSGSDSRTRSSTAPPRANANLPEGRKRPVIVLMIAVWAGATPASFEAMPAPCSLRRMVEAGDVANLAEFLCRGRASNISGKAISVDGHVEYL
jgi:hypothetical protein